MAEVDLSQLLGGDAFTLPCTVSNNGLGIKTSSLIDTGANGYTFVDTQFARTVERFLGIKPRILKDQCKVRGFDGQQTTPITEFLELMLTIDGRQIRIPMLVVGLGDHDMILGRKWFVHTGVLIDCKNRKLLWPDNQPRIKGWAKTLIATKEALELREGNPVHQADADRRDKLQAMSESWRPQILKREPLDLGMQPKVEERTWRKE